MTHVHAIAVDGARRFSAQHWPVHNEKQGIVWEQAGYALAAYDGDDCVGVAIYGTVGGLAQLEQLVVVHDRVGAGIGSRLLQAFEAHVRELGCHLIQLETAETQAPKFYERHGYQRAYTCLDGRFHLAWHTYSKRLRSPHE
jgi:GNAT superfamily N-acetyltransferase